MAVYHVRRVAGRGGSVAVRVLVLVVAAFAILYGCGQAGSPVEPADVGAVRARTKNRTRPWTDADLLALAGQPRGSTTPRP